MLYMASVQNSKGEHSCGGFLINKQFVVTAAHCRWDPVLLPFALILLHLMTFSLFISDPTSVILGTHNLKKIDNRTMRYPVERACKYPSYQNVKSGNDIMLLKVSLKLRWHEYYSQLNSCNSFFFLSISVQINYYWQFHLFLIFNDFVI